MDLSFYLIIINRKLFNKIKWESRLGSCSDNRIELESSTPKNPPFYRKNFKSSLIYHGLCVKLIKVLSSIQPIYVIIMV